jgi:hypothetical protein
MPSKEEIQHLLADKYRGDFLGDVRFEADVNGEVLYMQPLSKSCVVGHKITKEENDLSISQFDLIVVYPAIEALVKHMNANVNGH